MQMLQHSRISNSCKISLFRADNLSDDLKELQGQLGDYNMLMDKINTNNDLDGVETQYQMLKSNNQRETHVLDDIFIQRQQYNLMR